jgi:hypothetical protein
VCPVLKTADRSSDPETDRSAVLSEGHREGHREDRRPRSVCAACPPFAPRANAVKVGEENVRWAGRTVVRLVRIDEDPAGLSRALERSRPAQTDPLGRVSRLASSSLSSFSFGVLQIRSACASRRSSTCHLAMR